LITKGNYFEICCDRQNGRDEFQGFHKRCGHGTKVKHLWELADMAAEMLAASIHKTGITLPSLKIL
jgi:hypothetical protein